MVDLPFGSYEEGPTQALRTAVRFMKEGGCHAVKLEGGRRCAEQIAAISGAGIPVMAHIGFTPQSEHAIGGYRVQGRSADGASLLKQHAQELSDAGAAMCVLELVTSEAARQVAEQVSMATIGIELCDAGFQTAACDTQDPRLIEERQPELIAA